MIKQEVEDKMDFIEIRTDTVNARLPWSDYIIDILIDILDGMKDVKKEVKVESFDRAPNNTALFLNWLKSNNLIEFKIDKFIDSFGCINKESAEKIIQHQIVKGILIQMSNSSFKVNKKELKKMDVK